jgi:hypothetical protein
MYTIVKQYYKKAYYLLVGREFFEAAVRRPPGLPTAV